MQQRFHHAMRAILAATNATPSKLAVAYSGGLDSAVLLHLCAAYAREHGITLRAFHVHHGISPNADDWLAHCRQQCVELDVAFEAAYVQLNEANADGVEAAARQLRYHALGEMCQRHQVDVVLTAHHQDDQAETILLQLLRGAGVAGLCGMQQWHAAPGLLRSQTLLLARPLLDCSRAELEQMAAQLGVQHIEDESNSDIRYARNQSLAPNPVIETFRSDGKNEKRQPEKAGNRIAQQVLRP